MKSFLITIISIVFFGIAVFFYLFLYDIMIIGIGKLTTFILIMLAMYGYISLMYIVDKSKKLL